MPTHLSTHGPGCINKYTTVNYSPVLVNYRQRKGNRLEDGRPLFQNHNNPHQFDKTTINRQLCVEQKIGERREAEDAKWAEENMGDKLYDVPESPLSVRSRTSSRASLGGRSSSLPVDMRKATLCTSPTLREQLPIGLRPARGKFNSNSVLNIPNSMPGYTGYIEGKTSENVYGYRTSVLNTLCRDTRVGASASSWAGRKFDGISGYIPPPVPFGSVQTRFEHP
jgi:hypothetical protein